MKEMVKYVDKPKSPEEKQYLICIDYLDGDHSEWLIKTGRTESYKYIKDVIEGINLETSFILVETCKLSERKSIYSFMKYVGDMFEDNFDIDDYIKGDWDENVYKENNEIDPKIILDDADKLDMASFMNGEIQSTSLT